MTAEDFEKVAKRTKLFRSSVEMLVVIRRSERFVDHLARRWLEYRELLKITEAATTPITRAALETQQCSGVSAWAVTQNLESFFMEW